MKKYIILSICLIAMIDATAQEKKCLNDTEYKRLISIISSDNIIEERDNRDTIKIDGKAYSMFISPIDILDGASDILYNRPSGFSPGMSLRKRYTLNFEVIDGFLYLTGFHLAPDYKSEDKEITDVAKSIEFVLGKKLKNGCLKVDWLTAENFYDCNITLYVADKSRKVYSLEFEKGKLVKKTLEENIQIEKFSLPRLEDLKIKK